MVTAYTDHDLFTLIAQEDEAAFSEFFRRYDKRIYPFVLRMIKNSSHAEEITQEIFIKIWTNRAKLPMVEQPESYVLTITARHTLDHIKKRLNETKMLQRLTLAKKGHHENSTDETLLLRDSTSLIQSGIEQLPPQQKIVFQLSRQQGLNYDEIAAQLGLSPNTVRNHLVKALSGIRAFMKAHNGLPLSLCALIIKDI